MLHAMTKVPQLIPLASWRFTLPLGALGHPRILTMFPLVFPVTEESFWGVTLLSGWVGIRMLLPPGDNAPTLK